MTEEEIRPIAENYVEEYCHCSDGEYTDGSLVCAGIGTALIVSRQLEKQIADLKELLINSKRLSDTIEKAQKKQIAELEKENLVLHEMNAKRLDLQKENAELKTKKIPQLERKIASIRGSHSADVKKLNARIEQVERLKSENVELKERAGCIIEDLKALYFSPVVTKADLKRQDKILAEAEQFLNSEVEK